MREKFNKVGKIASLATALSLGVGGLEGCATARSVSKVPNQVEAGSSLSKDANVGSAVVESDGDYWLREEHGWRAYTADGFVQGSWLGCPLGEEPIIIESILKERNGKFYPEGYGEEGRERIRKFGDNLPSMTIFKEGDTGVSLDGVILGEQEFLTFTQGMEELAQSEWKVEDMLQDKKLDAVEIYNLANYGHMRYGIEAGQMPNASYVMGEIERYCGDRINHFIETGVKESDVNDLGILAVFELEDAMLLKGVRDALREQSEYNRRQLIPEHGYFLKGELGETNTADRAYGIGCGYPEHKAPNPEGNIELVSRVISYMNSISRSDADRISTLLRYYYARTSMPLLMEEGGVELGFWNTGYQVTVTPEIKLGGEKRRI